MQWQTLTRPVLGLAVAAAALGAGSAQAAEITLDASGIFSYAALGDAANETRLVALASGVRVIGVAWDVTLSTNPAFASWLSEISVDVGDGSGAGFQLSPGFGDNFPGSASYAGSFDLLGGGLDFVVGPSGALTFEFFETFDDDAASVNPPPTWDGVWERGSSITISFVPEPASFGLAGLALLAAGLASRRRRA